MDAGRRRTLAVRLGRGPHPTPPSLPRLSLWVPSGVAGRRVRAISSVTQHYSSTFLAVAVAGRARVVVGPSIGASARTLSRLLHNELGMTFYEWRTQLRIYHALVLLAEGHDTTHVAHACGWANPSSFIAAFTNLVGTTPGRHRATHRHP